MEKMNIAQMICKTMVVKETFKMKMIGLKVYGVLDNNDDSNDSGNTESHKGDDNVGGNDLLEGGNNASDHVSYNMFFYQVPDNFCTMCVYSRKYYYKRDVPW